MPRIGLFGGTFNPIHNGHILCPESLVKRNILDKVIFIPSYMPPLKKNPANISPEMRLEMVRLAVSPYPFFQVSDMEIKRQGTSYTIDTVKQLRQAYPKDDLTIILGTDWGMRFHEWKDYEALSEIVNFVVMQREGSKEDMDNPLLSEPVRKKLAGAIVSVPAVPVSSSEIRKKINDKAFLRKYLPEKVYRYIEEKKLYQ